MFPSDEKLIRQDLSARDYRLLNRAAEYARVLVAQATGRHVMKADVLCYTSEGSHPAPAIYDQKMRSIGVHKYLLENITDHLEVVEKAGLELMLTQQRPFAEIIASIENCAGIIGALIHEHAHHQFYTGLGKYIHALLRRRGEHLVDGLSDLRVKAINEGFAYAVQEKATGFVALSEEMASKYDNPNILAKYYAALRGSQAPLADALLDMIERDGFSDYVPMIVLQHAARKEVNRLRLRTAQERCRQRQARRQATCSS